MPAFRYKAYAASGNETSGTITAETEKQAVLKLREQGVFPHQVSLRKTSASKAKPDTLPFITRQLALLTASGVTVLDALRSLSTETKGHWGDLLGNIADDVSSGMSLSRALGQYTIFPEFYVKMVASGEASGAMDTVLKSLADFLDEEARTKARVKAALIYPAFMVVVGAVILSFIFAFVMPKITKIFSDSGKALPLATRLLMFISGVFINYWWAIFLLVIIAGYGFRSYYRKNRVKIDAMLMNSKLLKSLYLSRFTRALGFLLDGGLPVLKALELSGPSSGNLHIEKEVMEARQRLSEGAELSQALHGFPHVFTQLLATGQKSGQLGEAVKKAATSYDEDFKRRLDRSLALLEPSMILIMGGIVGFIVLAVLLPIFEMNQLVK
ncbi:MAG: type II secretion system F family protein [Nitrospiraceae bacterium]|nr:type II secretion system F family protein [Nitrospiraceae bacterium]